MGFGVCTVVFGGLSGYAHVWFGHSHFLNRPNCHFTAGARTSGAKLQAPGCSDSGGGCSSGDSPRAHRTWRRRAKSGPKVGGAQAQCGERPGNAGGSQAQGTRILSQLLLLSECTGGKIPGCNQGASFRGSRARKAGPGTQAPCKPLYQ